MIQTVTVEEVEAVLIADPAWHAINQMEAHALAERIVSQFKLTHRAGENEK